MNGPPEHDAEWDAGEAGCGEILVKLHLRFRALPPGSLFKLTARDPAAPEDLPAWCRLTGHAIAAADHPRYWIRTKER